MHERCMKILMYFKTYHLICAYVCLSVHRPPVRPDPAREAPIPVRKGCRQHWRQRDPALSRTLHRGSRKLPPDVQRQRHLGAQERRIQVPRQGELYVSLPP